MENNKIVVFDIETTGCHPINDSIIEIGAVKVVDDVIVDEWNELIDPRIDIPENITALTGITTDMVKGKPTIETLLKDFIEFCDGYTIMGHNVIFDYSFIKAKALEQGYIFEKYAIDTLKISRQLLSNIPSRKLGALCEYYNIDLANAHRAKHDAKATYEVYTHMKNEFYSFNCAPFLPEKLEWEPPEIQMITDRQKSYIQGLIRKHNAVIEKPINEFTKAEASKLIDQVLKKIKSK
jgi:DNA polymerase-3 subunit alpha (Gram-positive type)